jgi:hypothetical protein
MSAGRRVTARWVRPALLVIAIPQVATGVFALLAPAVFYAGFPAPGRRWVSALGPYNEHLTTDVGAALVALGVLVAFAAVLLDRLLLQGALMAWLIFSVAHLSFHLGATGPFGTADNVANFVTLGLPVAIAAAVLVHTVRRPGPRSGTGAAGR